MVRVLEPANCINDWAVPQTRQDLRLSGLQLKLPMAKLPILTITVQSQRHALYSVGSGERAARA